MPASCPACGSPVFAAIDLRSRHLTPLLRLACGGPNSRSCGWAAPGILVATPEDVERGIAALAARFAIEAEGGGWAMAGRGAAGKAVAAADRPTEPVAVDLTPGPDPGWPAGTAFVVVDPADPDWGGPPRRIGCGGDRLRAHARAAELWPDGWIEAECGGGAVSFYPGAAAERWAADALRRQVAARAVLGAVGLGRA